MWCAVTSSARITPEIESTDEVRMAIGAGKLRNSASSTPKTSASASTSTCSRSLEGLLLLLVGAAVFDAHRWRQMQAGNGLLHLLHGATEVGAFQVGRDHDQLLQIFAQDFVLRRQSARMVASEPRLAVWPELLLKTVFSIASSELRCSSPRRTRMV